MGGFTLAHLALAAVSVFMCVMHLAMWLVVKGNRVQLWVALTFFGYALVNLGIAGSSEWSSDIGNRVVWMLLGIIAIFPLWLGLLLTAWGVVERKLTRVRMFLLGLAAIVAAVRFIDVVIFLMGAETVSWEQVMNSNETVTVYAAWVMTLECGSVCVWEGAAAVRRRPVQASVLGILALAAGGIVVRELLLTLNLSEGPTLLGATSIPFMVFAFLLVAYDYIVAMRAHRNDVLRQYKPIRPLGQGGMGELYLASRRGPAGFERHVAIKRIRGEPNRSKEWTERFLSEARLAAQLRHPNIVSVYDLGRTDDGWFIVMEYLSGSSLLEVRRMAKERDAQIPVEFVVTVCEQVCRGLGRAHQAGIIHRDVSPHNIMVTFEGDVKVVDFGIAKEHGAPEVGVAEVESEESLGSSDLTRTGIVVGKRAYLSPERIAGMSATPASDVFSLGVVMYELLALRRPFRGKTPTALARAIMTGIYPALDRLRPDVPMKVVDVIDKALATQLEMRYAKVTDLGSDLRLLARELPLCDPGEALRGWFPRKWRGEEEMNISGRAPVVGEEPDNPTGPSLVPQAGDGISEEIEDLAPTTPVSHDSMEIED